MSLSSGVTTSLIAVGKLPATGWIAAAPGLATSGALFLVSGFSLKSRAKDHKLRAVQQACFVLIAEALIGIASHAGVATTTLGASVFVVHRSVWARLSRRPGVLKRIARLRFGETPNKSRVKWTMGKGCVGRAWKSKNEDYKWWTTAELEEQKKDSEAGRRGREEMTDSERAALAGKYCEVRAAAIISSAGKVVGVLSVDRPAVHKEGKTKVLASDTAKKMTAMTASLLMRALPDP
ncbi:hypothetical protein A5648_02445 [Mycolicibacter sinensis]|uniref:Uncharacterized protein n=1 Tax=Mycolicibacter sinensis (strain JDM601) TaxID=875328 RepID=A0A1A3TYC7_MYCSD|nr:hypothetical protein A5648_02445 [Mycolicibacter sinensis]